VLAAVVGAGCHPERPALTVPLDDWKPFYWATVASGATRFDRAAILVPDPRGQTGAGLLQLDLAGSGALPYGYPSAVEPDPSLLDVRLHGLLTAWQPVVPTRSAPGAPPPARLDRLGTLGLPAFSVTLLLIDFKRQRYGTLPSRRGDPPAFLTGRPAVPLEGAGDRLLVPLSVGTTGLHRVMLDTGLSPFPLWVDCPTWSRLTGRDRAAPGQARYRIDHPEGELTFVTGVTRDPVRLGELSLGRLEVVCLTDGPAEAAFDAWPFRVGGVLGARAFGDRTLLVLDPRNGRLWVESAGR